MSARSRLCDNFSTTFELADFSPAYSRLVCQLVLLALPKSRFLDDPQCRRRRFSRGQRMQPSCRWALQLAPRLSLVFRAFGLAIFVVCMIVGRRLCRAYSTLSIDALIADASPSPASSSPLSPASPTRSTRANNEIDDSLIFVSSNFALTKSTKMPRSNRRTLFSYQKLREMNAVGGCELFINSIHIGHSIIAGVISRERGSRRRIAVQRGRDCRLKAAAGCRRLRHLRRKADDAAPNFNPPNAAIAVASAFSTCLILSVFMPTFICIRPNRKRVYRRRRRRDTRRVVKTTGGGG